MTLWSKWLSVVNQLEGAFSRKRTFFWLFVSDTLILGWIGGNTAEAPYILIGKIATISYFGYFLFIIPLLSYLDRRAFTR